MKVYLLIVERLRELRTKEDGGTLAELAIIIPFLAIMLAGVSEFGRYFQTYTTLAKSTRTAARYLSNHAWIDAEKDKARNLAVCEKLECVGGDEVVPGITVDHICIESTGDPNPVTVKVSIPKVAGDCGEPYLYRPVFDLGALLHSQTLTLDLPVTPSTTMYYMLDD